MEENKVSHSFLTLLTWALTVVSWTVEHMGVIAGIAAVIAAYFASRASRATERLREQQRLDLVAKHRRDAPKPAPTADPPEPDTDI